MKVCYFTATGNCLYAAKRIGGELLSIPQCVRTFDGRTISAEDRDKLCAYIKERHI